MKMMHRYIPTTAVYFVLAAVFLMLSFTAFRLVLLMTTAGLADAVPSGVLFQSFLVGLRFDFAVTSYLMLPLVLLGLVPFVDITRSVIIRRINAILLIVLTAAAFLFHLIDIEFFRFFNSRLNGTAMIWKEDPGFVTGMIWDMYPVIRYMLILLVLTVGVTLLVRWAQRRMLTGRTKSPVLTNTVYLIVLLSVFGLGARGRLEEKSPLRWGLAYFSKYDYANQLALNPTFTFLHDAVYRAGSRQQVSKLLETIHDPAADKITRQMLGRPLDSANTAAGRIVEKVRFEPPGADPANVILIIMESFGSTAIGSLDRKFPYDLSPCFDSLADSGLLCTDFYSNGMHTYSGLFSSLYGYPPGFGPLIMKQTAGQYDLNGLPQILRAHDYRTLFFTTHDPHFDNMQGFLMANGVEQIYSLFDYDTDEKLSTLGVPDHVMFDRAADVLRQQTGQRFFATLLTGSNHGPWTIPDVVEGKVSDADPLHKQLNAFKYSDWALGRFVRRLEADVAFDNTLIVVTADNGLLHQPTLDMDLSQYRIPLLLYWIGADKPAPARIDRLGSQIDIVATVMARLRLSYDNCTFGNDLLEDRPQATRFAHFSEWYLVGYIQDSLYSITRMDGPESLYRLNDRTRDIADSLKPVVADYNRRALAIYQAAYHNMRRVILDRP
jgi:phosphoglycerol transferase MdoB-like AlkP superfamily enzyme